MGTSVAQPGRTPGKPRIGRPGRIADMRVLPRDVRWFLYRGFLLN